MVSILISVRTLILVNGRGWSFFETRRSRRRASSRASSAGRGRHLLLRVVGEPRPDFRDTIRPGLFMAAEEVKIGRVHHTARILREIGQRLPVSVGVRTARRLRGRERRRAVVA